MKDTKLTIMISRRLHDALQTESERHKIPMSAYIRAVLNHQVSGDSKQQEPIVEGVIKSRGGDIVLDV